MQVCVSLQFMGPTEGQICQFINFFDKINSNKKIYVYNYGNHYRSFTYISDIIYNIDKLLKFTKKNVNERDAQVFNIEIQNQYILNI